MALVAEARVQLLLLTLSLLLARAAPCAPPAFRAGAAAVDIGPRKLPVIVNAMFEERSAGIVHDPLHARCVVLDDGAVRIALAVVDSCMLPRDLLDEAKALAGGKTGIPPERILVSATHTHSAPSAMGCLGSRPDPDYARFLPGEIARAIEIAAGRLEPALFGWTVVRAPGHTFNRRWIFRPDRMGADPFGERTIRANMHPGHENPDAIGPSGPVDPEIIVLSFQSPGGRPIALLANFPMHYYGSPLLSADYQGKFVSRVESVLGAAGGGDGGRPFVAMMSQGTSGDLMWMDYGRPRSDIGYEAYADQIARLVLDAHRRVEHREPVSLAMRESRLSLRRRVPGEERLVWARSVVSGLGDRLPRTLPEIYAREQLYLHESPAAELKLQAIRIGDLGIAAIPNEVFAITGLKIKARSPLVPTMTIELANGSEGYIPPPEQHRLGGYTTWAARTAGLEVEAEPKILEEVLRLLEDAAGKPRREPILTHGPAARAVLASKPLAYWRLDEMSGPAAAEATGSGRAALYAGDVAFHLDGPHSGAFSGAYPNRAPHLAGGRIEAGTEGLGPDSTLELWVWNGLAADARAVTGHIFWRGEGSAGEGLAIGGTAGAPGRLVFSTGASDAALVGATALGLKMWSHVAFVREGSRVKLYLDGKLDAEGAAPPLPPSSSKLSIGGRAGGEAGLEGKVDEMALYGRALSAEEVAAHHAAAASPPPRLRAGAATSNITPPLGTSMNGGFQDRRAENVHDELHARCLVLDDGSRRLAIAVCDSCMVPREVIDEAKAAIEREAGIPADNVLISATHTHTAPSAAAVFQSEADPGYRRFLASRIADGVRRAARNLAPVRIGWGVAKEPRHVFNRRWRMRPGSIPPDPFGGTTDQVKMNPIPGSADLVEPAGPTDPDVSVVYLESPVGRPVALLANYSLHYVGGTGAGDVSADYFGAFARSAAEMLRAEDRDAPPFVAILSNGTSGDVNNIDFRGGGARRAPYEQIRAVAEDVARAAVSAARAAELADWAPLDARVRKLELGVRRPSAEDVARAREVLSKARGPVLGKPEEVYARESLLLADYPEQVEVVVQALRVGDLAIAAIPCEVFAEIGLELKSASPFRTTFTIELANGYNGYLPTPEQHRLGGYETWRARSSYLEVDASTRIVEAVLVLLAEMKSP